MEPKKDIFEDIQAEPLEHYTFQIDPASMEPVEKKYIGKLIKRMIIGILCGVILFFFGFSNVFYFGMGFAIALFVSVSFIAAISNTKKSYAAAKEKYAHSLFDYALYDDCLVIEANSEKGITKKKCQLNEIARAEEIGGLIVLEIDRQLWLLNKNELIENSYFIERCAQNDDEETPNKKVVRFVLTFFLGWVGSLIINHTKLKPKGYTSRTGAYLLISMVTVGIYTLVASFCNLAFNPTKPRNIGYKKDNPQA